MDFSWAIEGITEETPRTTGPECFNYMTNRRRWLEALIFTSIFIYIIKKAVHRMDPIVVPTPCEKNKPHSALRLLLLISMTFIFGIEMGFKFSGRSVIFVLNPCHIQTVVQIYLLASRPNKVTIALFRIQMNNLNGPFLAFLFPEVEYRTLPFEQATYWIQHALLYLIPVYILQSGAYRIEDISDYNWVTIGVMIMLLYHFVVLNAISIFTGINLNHMLCAAVTDPFQGQNYRIAAVIHESILCPILNKGTVLIFNRRVNCSYADKGYDNNDDVTSLIYDSCSCKKCSTISKMPSTMLLQHNISTLPSMNNAGVINDHHDNGSANTDHRHQDCQNEENVMDQSLSSINYEDGTGSCSSSVQPSPVESILKNRRRHTAANIYDTENNKETLGYTTAFTKLQFFQR